MVNTTNLKYSDLIQTIAEHLLTKIQSDENENDEDFKEWVCREDLNFFDECLSEYLGPFVAEYMIGIGWQTTSNPYPTLDHEAAIFILKNSDNLHHSIDGMYRKDNYRDVASGCIQGDVLLHIAKKFGVQIDPEDCMYFNRGR